MLSTAPWLFGQSARLLVVFAEGKGFTLIREDREQFVDFSTQSPVGFELEAGDMVNVEAGTNFEFQLFPTLTVIRVSESSSFVIQTLDARGNYNFDVLYGRLRTRIDKSAGQSYFTINEVDITAESAGTDFGYDRIFTDGKEFDPAIYCFQGTLSVSAAGAAVAAGSPVKVNLAPDEIVTVTRAPDEKIRLIKTELKPDVAGFWQKNEFQSRPTRTPPSETDTAQREQPVMMPEETVLPPETTTTAETDKGRYLSGYVDNTDASLDDREKLSEVTKTDRAVNPNLTGEQEREPNSVTAATEDTARTEEAPPATTTEESATTENKETVAEETATEKEKAPANGESVVSFQMDLGLAVNYLVSLNPPGLTPIPTVEWITDFLEFLMRFQVGAILDVELMFFNIFGIGVESGILYNEITAQRSTFEPYLYHFISIPVFLNLRFTLGPVLIQPQAGIVIPGSTLSGSLAWGDPLYEAGGKVGFRLGNMALYVNVGFISTTFEGIFDGSADFYFGGGLLFKIF